MTVSKLKVMFIEVTLYDLSDSPDLSVLVSFQKKKKNCSPTWQPYIDSCPQQVKQRNCSLYLLVSRARQSLLNLGH